MRLLKSHHLGWISREKPHAQTRRLPQFYLVLFEGEKFLFVPPLPFPIFDLVHIQYIYFFMVQMSSCLSEQLLPGNWITGEKKTANYLVTFCTGP